MKVNRFVLCQKIFDDVHRFSHFYMYLTGLILFFASFLSERLFSFCLFFFLLPFNSNQYFFLVAKKDHLWCSCLRKRKFTTITKAIKMIFFLFRFVGSHSFLHGIVVPLFTVIYRAHLFFCHEFSAVFFRSLNGNKFLRIENAFW